MHVKHGQIAGATLANTSPLVELTLSSMIKSNSIHNHKNDAKLLLSCCTAG